MADPTIQLRDSNGDPVVDNDDWREDPKQEALIIATGLAPSNDLESAIFVSLLPGTYTTLVQGNAGGTGIGYVQFYSLPHTGAASAVSAVEDIPNRCLLAFWSAAVLRRFQTDVVGADPEA